VELRISTASAGHASAQAALAATREFLIVPILRRFPTKPPRRQR
jgi:hypothetical protein